MNITEQHDAQRQRRLLGWFLAMAAVTLSLGCLRVWPPRCLLSPSLDILPLYETLSLLILVPLLIVSIWNIYLAAAGGARDGWSVLCVIGVYFLGVGLGMHDICNQLGLAYQRTAPAPLCQSLAFFDDRLGHWFFWGGFFVISVAIGAQQLRHPLAQPMSPLRTLLWAALSAPMIFIMLANLMFENTRADLAIIVGAAAAIAGGHCVRRIAFRRLPLLCLIYPGYAGAVLGTLIYWLVRR